jgi:flavin reductase (DIM6/NTAB) family NADH-FMN oxidoreductase RutF
VTILSRVCLSLFSLVRFQSLTDLAESSEPRNQATDQNTTAAHRSKTKEYLGIASESPIPRPTQSKDAERRPEQSTTLEHSGLSQRVVTESSKEAIYVDNANERIDSIEFRKLMRHILHPVVVISTLELPSIDEAALTRNVDSQEGAAGSRESQTSSEARSIAVSPASDVIESPTQNIDRPIPRAMTVSSFTSLSLDPTPSVIFNISLPSHTYTAIESSRRFNVHVLNDNEAGALLAQRFAKGHSRFDMDRGKETHRWKSEWETWINRKRKDSNLNAWTPLSRDAIPIIQTDGVLYTLRCVVRKSVQKSPNQSSGLLALDANTALVIGEVEDVVYSTNVEHTHNEGIQEDSVGLSYTLQKYRKRGEVLEFISSGDGKEPNPVI